MYPEIGSAIQRLRQNLGWSIDDLAAGICTPAILTAIEAGTTLPDLSTITGIGQRFNVRVNRFNFDEEYPVGRNTHRNERLSTALTQQDFPAVKKLLMSPEYADATMTDAQAQAYYLYLGWADIQADENLDGARYNLHMALVVNPKRCVLTALAYASTAFVAAKDHKTTAVHDAAREAVTVNTQLAYSPDRNCVNYILALSFFADNDLIQSAQFAISGLHESTRNHDQTLLLHFYCIIARIIARATANQQTMAALMTVTDWDQLLKH